MIKIINVNTKGPSLKVKRYAEIIKDEVLNSKARFENVDIEELGIYLRENVGKEYIVEQGYEHLLPKKMNIRKNKVKVKRHWI